MSEDDTRDRIAPDWPVSPEKRTHAPPRPSTPDERVAALRARADDAARPPHRHTADTWLALNALRLELRAAAVENANALHDLARQLEWLWAQQHEALRKRAE